MKSAVVVCWIAGAAGFVGLLVYKGLADILRAVADVGWGLLLVTAFHTLPLLCDTASWRTLVDDSKGLSFQAYLRIRWIAESVNTLLPAAFIGGELVRVRAAMLGGMDGVTAGASVTVGVMLAILSQIVFSLMGIAVLVHLDVAGETGMALPLTTGVVLFAAITALLMLIQRMGMFRMLAGFLVKFVKSGSIAAAVGGAKDLDSEISTMYSRTRSLVISFSWLLAGWMAGTMEIWLALHFLAHPTSFVDAFMLESLIQAIRNAAFIIPGGLGVQEGGLILLGAAIHIPPEIALALSLVKRVRELILGLPGLVAWQIMEGRRFLGRRST